jgi:hypothetical protein
MSPREAASLLQELLEALPVIPITTLAYICTKRRYESYANRSLFAARASASTVSSLSPRFRMVSIIPGIDTEAPDLTETRSGAAPIRTSCPTPPPSV